MPRTVSRIVKRQNRERNHVCAGQTTRTCADAGGLIKLKQWEAMWFGREREAVWLCMACWYDRLNASDKAKKTALALALATAKGEYLGVTTDLHDVDFEWEAPGI